MRKESVQERLISIVIPVYKTALPDLKLCLEGIKKQTQPPLEVLLIFDEETTPYQELLDYYCRQEYGPPFCIRIFKQEHKGVSSARNYGINEAKGKYIFFHDSDDYMEADALLKIQEKAVESEAEIVAAEYYRCLGRSRERHCCRNKDCHLTKKEEIRDFAKEVLKPQTGAGFVWAKLFKTEWLKKNHLYFSGELAVAEDAEFMIRAVNRAGNIYYTNIPIYNYCFHSDSTVRKYREDYAERYVRALEKIKAFVTEDEERADLKPALMNCIVYHLLLIAVNDSFHPDKKKSLRDRIKEFSNIANQPLFREALGKVNCKEFSVTRRAAVVCIRLHCYLGIAAISAVRHLQFKK